MKITDYTVQTINQVVEYATMYIHAHSKHKRIAFMVNTQFGDILIETKSGQDCANVYTINRAPGTKFVLENRGGQSKWYIQIGWQINQQIETTREQVVSSLVNIMLKEISGKHAIVDNDCDMLTHVYYHVYESENEVVSMIRHRAKREASLFCRTNDINKMSSLMLDNYVNRTKNVMEYFRSLEKDASKDITMSIKYKGLDQFHQFVLLKALLHADCDEKNDIAEMFGISL